MSFHSSIQQLQKQIDSACERYGRTPESVCILPVSKTFGFDAIQEAIDDGQLRFGENRPQELKQKAEYFQEHAPDLDIKWVQIGYLQSNKAKEIARFASELQSLDRLSLAEALEKRLQNEGRELDTLIQVKTSTEESKSGLAPEDVPAFLDELKAFDCLRLKGFMTVAENTDDEARVRECFAKLRTIAEAAREQTGLPLETLSMGMSGDFELAIAEGATEIRIGSALFGKRDYSAD